MPLSDIGSLSFCLHIYRRASVRRSYPIQQAIVYSKTNYNNYIFEDDYTCIVTDDYDMLACLVFVQARPEPVVDPNIIFTGNLDLHVPALNFKFFI